MDCVRIFALVPPHQPSSTTGLPYEGRVFPLSEACAAFGIISFDDDYARYLEEEGANVLFSVLDDRCLLTVSQHDEDILLQVCSRSEYASAYCERILAATQAGPNPSSESPDGHAEVFANNARFYCDLRQAHESQNGGLRQ